MLNKIKNFFIKIFSILWVSLIACILACPGESGGAEINGFLAFLLWILFVYLVIKKYAVISCILSTILAFGIRIYKFGVGDMSGVSEIITQVIFWCVMLFIFYKLFFGNMDSNTGRTGKSQREKAASSYYEADVYSSSYETEEDSSYERHKDIGPKLKSGSDEYWEYKEAAEGIYRDFCAARTTDERLYHKKRGDKLKTHLLSEYGFKDECVRTIIDQFLDLRV